jgi:hypothetical protein
MLVVMDFGAVIGVNVEIGEQDLKAYFVCAAGADIELLFVIKLNPK